MPTYRYRCATHGDFDQWGSIHDDTTPPCPECGREGARPLRVMTSPRVSLYATPNKAGHSEVVQADAREGRWNRDMPAYKELRRQGYQPNSVDGSAVVQARAHDQMEIELNKAIHPADINHYREVKQQLDESAREGSFASEYGKSLPRQEPKDVPEGVDA